LRSPKRSPWGRRKACPYGWDEGHTPSGANALPHRRLRRGRSRCGELPWGIEEDAGSRWVMLYDPAGNLIELACFNQVTGALKAPVT